MDIIASSKQKYLQDKHHSSNAANRISIEIIQYKAADDNLTIEALQNQAKEAALIRKEIPV